MDRKGIEEYPFRVRTRHLKLSEVGCDFLGVKLEADRAIYAYYTYTSSCFGESD